MLKIGILGSISARSLDSAYASLGMMLISPLFNNPIPPAIILIMKGH